MYNYVAGVFFMMNSDVLVLMVNTRNGDENDDGVLMKYSGDDLFLTFDLLVDLRRTMIGHQ